MSRALEKTTIEELIRRAETALDDATRDGAQDRSAMEVRDEPASAAAPKPGRRRLEPVEEAHGELPRVAPDVEAEVHGKGVGHGDAEAAREPVVRFPAVEDGGDALRVGRVRDRERLAGGVLRREARRDAMRGLAVVADAEREAQVRAARDVLEAEARDEDVRGRREVREDAVGVAGSGAQETGSTRRRAARGRRSRRSAPTGAPPRSSARAGDARRGRRRRRSGRGTGTSAASCPASAVGTSPPITSVPSEAGVQR